METATPVPPLVRVTVGCGITALALAIGVAAWAAWLAVDTYSTEESGLGDDFEYFIAAVYVGWAALGAALAGCGMAARERAPRLSLGLALGGLALIAVPAISIATIPLSI